MAGLPNPRVDMVFKKIFGCEENKDLTISLINSVISQEDEVKDITLLNPYNAKEFLKDKLSILDIKARAKDGRLFNIEIQISDEADYDKRALYYWAKMYTQQLQGGDDYDQLNKAIGIHILNFTSIVESKKYHNEFHILEKETGVKYFKDLELHTVELSKFDDHLPKDLNEFVSKISTSLDMWSSFLMRYNLLKADNLPLQLNKQEMKKALSVLEQVNFSNQERDEYEDRLKWLRMEANTLKKRYNIGREEGIAEGIAEGMVKGRIAEKIEIAKNLLKYGVNIEAISQATGLLKEEIEKITTEKI